MVILGRKEQPMKDVRNWLILILLLIVIVGGFHTYNKTSKSEVSNIKEQLKAAVEPHLQVIKALEIEKKAKTEKIKKDSTAAQAAKVIYENKILSLQRKLKAVKYTGDPSKVSDDSVKIAMQALKEAPVKDMLLSSYEKEMDRLNAHIEGLQVDYSQLLDLSQQESNQKDKIINDWKVYSEGLEKEVKKSRRKGIGNVIKASVGVGVIMYIIGSLSD